MSALCLVLLVLSQIAAAIVTYEIAYSRGQRRQLLAPDDAWPWPPADIRAEAARRSQQPRQL